MNYSAIRPNADIFPILMGGHAQKLLDIVVRYDLEPQSVHPFMKNTLCL